MKTLKLTCIILLLSLAGYAQTKRILVADETELVTLKSSFKIETCNDAIFKLIQKEFTSLGFKYTATVKSDRKGLYTMYSVPFKQTEFEKVREFLKKLD